MAVFKVFYTWQLIFGGKIEKDSEGWFRNGEDQLQQLDTWDATTPAYSLRLNRILVHSYSI